MHGKTEENEGGKSYKDMNNYYYYISTLILFILEAILAIVIPDVSTVFDFLAAISVTCLGFAFPALFFIAAEKKFPNTELIKQNGFHRKMAYVHILLALIVFALSMTSNFINIYSNK